MATKKLAIGSHQLVVKITLSGKFTFKLSRQQKLELRVELHPYWISPERNIVDAFSLCDEMIKAIIKKLIPKYNWTIVGDQRFLFDRQQALAVVYALIKSEQPNMIQLKAALLKAL